MAETQADIETGLPAWTYTDPEFFALERDRIFAPSWQLVCHQSDIAERGQYATLNLLGALAFVVRGDDGAVRAFKNVCRHRAARLLDEPFGRCKSRIVCPYHAWSYDLQGRLIGVPERAGYEPLDMTALNLRPLAFGEAGGFIFVRFGDVGPSFEDYATSFRAELDLYKTADMRALGRITLRERAVNWKVATDNYVDALHLPVAHDGLNSLVGESYRLHVDGDAHRITSTIENLPATSLSVRAYRKFLPDAERLPEERRRAWVYLKLWPNLAFDIYPDQIDFMQFIPLSPSRTLLREISYALPDSRREMQAARYLNWRINRIVNLEDKDLIERVQAGLETGDYEPGPLSRNEICLRDFADRMRRELPVCRQKKRPAKLGAPS
ncbi:MAG: aromatic ring-hydroxylating dioxygenase subunit alpha [Parvularculaceae bacterium]